MTSQGAVIKTGPFLPIRFAGARKLFSRLAAAVSEWRRRRRTREALHQWMQHERGLQDMGISEFEAERAEENDRRSILREHFGYTALLFHHRGTSGPHGARDSRRERE